MAVTPAQARRVARHLDVPWHERVRDPRKPINLVHSHHGLLNLLALAFACGKVVLRQVEDLSRDLNDAARRHIGLNRVVSDSALYRLLAGQSVQGFRETLASVVRMLVKLGAIRTDAFKHGVLSIDGKTFFSSTTSGVDGAKTSVNESTGVITSTLMSVRAVLTSSLIRPCLDLEVIGEKEGEPPAFRDLLRRVAESFGDLFTIVTGDAGMACRENALVVLGAKKHYLFGLKGNQPTLEAEAIALFAVTPWQELARSAEVREGGVLRRFLHAVDIKDNSRVIYPEAAQFWRVTQQLWVGERLVREEARYFITDLEIDLFGADEALTLVRLHWGIENNHNWTMDVPLLEDACQPCQATKEALEVVGWLRVIGYNLLAAARAAAPKKDKLPQSWKRSMDKLRDAIIGHHEVALAPLA
jgi:hypothetical protein